MHIHIAGIGTIPWQGQHSILEAIEDSGVDISYSCRAGVCGACKIKLLEGKVHWRQQASVSIRHDEVLACAVVPLTDIHIAIPD